jgi:hypothetical protein
MRRSTVYITGFSKNVATGCAWGRFLPSAIGRRLARHTGHHGNPLRVSSLIRWMKMAGPL